MVYLTKHSRHFYLRIYDIIMINEHSDSEIENPLYSHRLVFPISSKGPFMCIIL